jgi:type II secretory pathway pseudopilin PulG
MKEKKLAPQSGISIIEVLIVVTVIAILTTVAIMQLGRSKIDFQRQRIAREFKVYLERARFDSVKRRAATTSEMSRVILNSATSFTIVSDFNQNGTILKSDGTLETSDRRVIDFTNRSDAQIVVSTTLNYPVTILYNQRGHITTTDGLNNPIAPVFTICSANCSGTSQEATVISVSTTGTVAVLKSGETPGVLPTPSAISNATPQFNCYVLVNSNVLVNSVPAPCINK